MQSENNFCYEQKNKTKQRSINFLHFWFCEKCWAQQKPVTVLVESESTSTVTTLSFSFSLCLCALHMNAYVCCSYGSCVCVLAGLCVGERCLSTNISACFRYWSVRLITDSLRFTSGSPGRTDTQEQESKALHSNTFKLKKNTKKWKKGKRCLKSAICCYF